jgi:hypothetical protein
MRLKNTLSRPEAASLLQLPWYMIHLTKIISLMLALTLSFNSVVWAEPENRISDARETELFEIAKNQPAEFLAKLTDDELIQLTHELAHLVQDLQQDFSATSEQKDGKYGFKLHEWGKVSVPLIIALTVFGILVRAKTFKNPVDNPATYLVILLVGFGVSIALNATKDNMVWLTPEEVQILQEKIMRLRKFSLNMEQRFK